MEDVIIKKTIGATINQSTPFVDERVATQTMARTSAIHAAIGHTESSGGLLFSIRSFIAMGSLPPYKMKHQGVWTCALDCFAMRWKEGCAVSIVFPEKCRNQLRRNGHFSLEQ